MATVLETIKTCIKEDRQNGYLRDIGGLILNVHAFIVLRSEFSKKKFNITKYKYKGKVVNTSNLKIGNTDYLIIILSDDDPITVKLYELTKSTNENREIGNTCLMCCIDKSYQPIF